MNYEINWLSCIDSAGRRGPFVETVILIYVKSAAADGQSTGRSFGACKSDHIIFFYKRAAPTALSNTVLSIFASFFLIFFTQNLFAQQISISVNDPHHGLLTVDSSNWNEAWVELDGISPDAKKLETGDVTVFNGEHFAEVLSVDSVGAKWKSNLALSFVLDNSGSMFHAFDSLTRNCDSLLWDLPSGVIGQVLVFDNRARSATHLYTTEHSTFIAQKFFTDSLLALSKFWHFYDSIRTQFTPLYDAIAAAATNIGERRMKNASPRNDVLLVVTDGDDNASRASIELVQEVLSSARIRLFAINFRTQEDNRLDWLARKTGGEFFVCDNIADLREGLREIGLSLTREYHITYRFPSLRPSGPR